MNIVVSFFCSLTLCLAICSLSRGISQCLVLFKLNVTHLLFCILFHDVACSSAVCICLSYYTGSDKQVTASENQISAADVNEMTY